MVEEFRKAPVENMDEVIYYVNGTYRLLEFLVSVARGHRILSLITHTVAEPSKGHITLEL